jgi:hypothetical protein
LQLVDRPSNHRLRLLAKHGVREAVLCVGYLGERFLVLHGDTYLRIDYGAVARRWRESGLPAMMTVLRNEGRWATSNVIYRHGMVLRYDKRAPSPEMRWIDYGLGGLTVRALDRAAASETDLAVPYERSPNTASCWASRPASASTRSARRPRCLRPRRSSPIGLRIRDRPKGVAWV